VLAINAAIKPHGVTRIYNAGRLRLKESDRLDTVCRMLTALGGSAKQSGDELIISGGGLTGGVIDSFGDHRIVMAAAIAACFCCNGVLITNAQAVEKSYPNFFEDYNKLGGAAYAV
jgi:3-phosphoshikimate 1-carboxyvinyltransferase